MCNIGNSRKIGEIFIIQKYKSGNVGNNRGRLAWATGGWDMIERGEKQRKVIDGANEYTGRSPLHTYTKWRLLLLRVVHSYGPVINYGVRACVRACVPPSLSPYNYYEIIGPKCSLIISKY